MPKITQFHFQNGIEYVKIHGLQRAGTNYLAHLINENFSDTESLMNVGGWKHGFYCAPWTLGQEVHVLTVVKNPYAWLLSLYKYWKATDIGPDLSHVSFDLFIRDKAVFEMQQGIPFLYRASNPVQHWNNMNFHWLSIRLNEKKCLTVPYEALLVETHGVLNAIGRDFGLKRRPRTVSPVNKLKASGDRPEMSDAEWTDKDYYLKEEFLKEYTPDMLKFVNDQLDPEVMNTLGYAFIKEDRKQGEQ